MRACFTNKDGSEFWEDDDGVDITKTVYVITDTYVRHYTYVGEFSPTKWHTFRRYQEIVSHAIQ